MLISLWVAALVQEVLARWRFARYAERVRKVLAGEDLVEINRDIALSERLTRINITRVLDFSTRPIITEILANQ